MDKSAAPVRIGVVGCARILPAHLRGMLRLRERGLDGFRVTALCARRLDDAAMFRRRGEGPSPRPPAAKNEQDPLGAPHLYVSDVHADPLPDLYDDWRAMLEADAVDAVLVLAPVALHHQIALDALAAGKHVLIEKPFAVSVRAGQMVVDEAKRRGLVVGVAENLRYAEGVRAAGWAIAEGLIGQPQLWLSGGVGGEWAPDQIVARTPWRHRKLDAGGGGAIDVGVHLMHLVRYLMGPVEEISAYVKTLEDVRFDRDDDGAVTGQVDNEVDDVFVANLRFANGAIGTMFFSWAGHGATTSLGQGPTIYGTTGSIKDDEITLDDGFHGKTATVFARRAAPELQRRFFPAGVRDPFGLELYDFLQAIRTGRQMEASGEEGVLDLAMAFSILESATANRPVSVQQVLTGNVATYQQDIDIHYGLPPAG